MSPSRTLTVYLGVMAACARTSTGLIVTVSASIFPFPPAGDSEIGLYEGLHIVTVTNIAQPDVGRVWLLDGEIQLCPGSTPNPTQVTCHKEGGIQSTQSFSKNCDSFAFHPCGLIKNKAFTFGGVLVGSGGTSDDASSTCKAIACPPCSSPSAESEATTWLLAPHGGPATVVEEPRVGSVRVAQRPESNVYLEEWAVLGTRDNGSRVRVASAESWRERLESSSGVYPEVEEGLGALLVHAVNHADNERLIPTPSLVPFTVTLEVASESEKQDFWFRAEVTRDQHVDRVLVLESSSPSLPLSDVHEAIRENLHLRYVGLGRHRSVVFGLGSIGEDGSLTVNDGLVIVPQCCGGPPCHPCPL